MTSFADPGSGGDSTRTATVNLNANVSGYSQQMNQAAASTGAMSSSVDALQSRMHDLNRWAGRKLFQFSAADFAVLGSATADAAVFQKQLGTLSATAAVTGTSMSSIKNGIESSFAKFPVARSQLVSLTEAITNLGVTAPRDINTLRDTFVKLGAATGEPMNELASGLIQLSRLMGTTDATQIGNYANSLLTVSKNAGVSASGVLQFGQSIAPFAKQAGIGESAVLGISTAFSKAGADGFVATNALNTMLSDISKATATGGPDLLKYSNLLGITVGQFKEMDKTKAVVDIFKQLTTLGPQAGQILDSLGLPGIRSQSAIAAVTQSGGLDQFIKQSEGAQGDQKNLNSGASAAMSSLVDSGARLRNVFTQIGTEIGTTFLKPLSMMANAAATVATHLNNLIKPFSGFIASLGVVGGVLTTIGGLAINLAGAIGAYALIKTVGRSVPISAFKAGFAGARTEAAGGMAEDPYTTGRQMPLLQRFGTRMFGTNEEKARLNGLMPWRQQVGYNLGYGGGGVAGAAGALDENAPLLGRGSLATYKNMGVGGMLRVPGMLAGQTERFLRESALSADERRTTNFGADRPPWRQSLRQFRTDVAGLSTTQVVGQEAPLLARRMGSMINAQSGVLMDMTGRVIRTGGELIGPRAVGGLIGSAVTGGLPGGGRAVNKLASKADDAGLREASAAAKESMASFAKTLTFITKEPGVAFHILGQVAKQTAMDLALVAKYAAATGAANAIGGAARVAGAGLGMAGTALGQIGRLGSKAIGAAFTIPGMLAMFGGERLYSRMEDHKRAVNLDNFINPIQKYNDMLGITTSNLANFNTALTSATSATGGITPTMATAAQVSQTDIGAAPKKPTVGMWSSLTHAGAGTLATALGSMQISDPGQLQLAKEDMLAAGIKASTVQSALSQWSTRGRDASGLSKGEDFARLGATAVTTEGRGTQMFGPSQSKSGAKIIGSMLTGINAQEVSDTQLFGGGYAAQKGLQNTLKGLAPFVQAIGKDPGGQNAAASGEALAHALSKMTGGGYAGYSSTISNQSHGVKFGQDMTPEQAQQEVVKVLSKTKQGVKYLKTITGSGGTETVANMDEALTNLMNTGDSSSFVGLLKTLGPLGKFVASNATTRAAFGLGSQNFSTTQQATDLIQQQQMGNTTSGGGAMASIGGVMTHINTSSPEYAQLQAAQQQILQNQQYQAPYQSRAQNFATSATNFTQADETYKSSLSAGTATPDQKAWLESTRQSYQTAQAAATDYFKQTYQAAIAFGNQMARAAQDEGIAVANTKKDFALQQQYANEDFNKQTLRSEHDFGLQRVRMQQDFDTQMANQAQQMAQTIYSPYLIVQSKYTTDAGQVLQNMLDQNKYIAQQNTELAQVSKMGLSTQAIQTLDLSNPDNAQELNQLVQDLMNDPKLIAQINAEAAKRNKGTAALTTSPFNLQFAQAAKAFQLEMTRGLTDFDTAQMRASSDFHQSMDRAQTAETLALSRMATAYSNSVSRASQDMALAQQELVGGFQSFNEKAMAAVANSVAKYSPAAAAVMRTQLTQLEKEFPGLGLSGPTSATGATYIGQYSGNNNPNVPKVAPPTTSLGGLVGVTPTKPPAKPVTPPPPVHYGPPPHKNAVGGIATSAQYGIWGEAGPEAMIPLNESGQSFMAGIIAKALAQGITMAYGSQSMGSSSTIIDQSTSFAGAQIDVVAQDPNAMARQLKAAENLRRLSSPIRH